MTPKEALEKFRDAIERSDARALELMINSKERPRPLELVEENDDVKITDFKNSNGENIFDILSNNYTDKDKDLKLFLLLLKTLPEYQNVTKIPFFFFYADEKKSNNISSTARFKPVTATAGNPWQSSISPESALKKKIIAIDASFFQKNNSPTLQNRKMLQITRMLREGFSILYRNSNDQLVELRDNFDKDELLKLKPFKEEDYEFLAEASDTRDPIARSQVLPLDESRSKSLETLFCAPFNTVSFQDLHSKDATFYNKEFVSLYFKIDETDSQDILRKASSNISGVIEDLGKMDKETRIKFITLFVASGNLELIKKILESFKYMYAVAQNAAAQNGHVGVIKLLLENGVKINDMHTALYAAAHNGHAEVVELLLDNKVSVNGKSTGGWTALYAAACNSHAKVVELLLDNGAIINEKNPGGWTALNVTAKNGHVEVVKLLIARGANVNEKTTDNWTALHIATYNGHAEVAKLLIARGANIKEKNKDNWTALHIAAYNGHAKVVELLLDNGAIINEKTANNSNALYVAAQNGHAEVVELLLDNGANINEKTAGGWTALHIAEHNGHTEVAELLTAHGAKKINYHRTAPPHTNNLNINIGPLSNKSHDKVTDTSNDRFDMYKVGSLLNPNQQKFSHPARLRVSVSIMDFPENDIASYKTLAAKNLTEVKDFATTLVKNNKIYQEQIEQYKEERNVAYYEIQYRVKKSKSLHQLFSVNYSGVDLAQITVPKGVEITQLSKDEFGFYHIATSKPCIIKYVLKFNPQQPEISESNPIKQLADEYQRNVERAKTSTEVVPTLENNDYDKFYEKVFKSGKGSCILRTAAFVREVEKKFPNIKIGQDFIVENIDRNHTAIGVIENGQISYLELGGINSANVVNHSSNYYKTGVDGLLITLSEAASKITSRLQRSAIEKFLRRIKNYFTRSNKIGIAPITKEETINTNTGQNSSTKKQPSTKPNSLASFCQQNVATENYQNLAQEQDLQNLLHDSKSPALLIATKTIDSCVNKIIKIARPSRPVFYIDHPSKIDILKTAIKATNPLNPQIAEGGDLADFFKDAEKSNPSQPKPLLIINWSAFSSQERTALNSAIDEQKNIDGKSFSNIDILSVCNQPPQDRSFITRHKSFWKTGFEIHQEKITPQDNAKIIDLEGFENWQEKLFGEIYLEKNIIKWRKSNFVENLEKDENNFTINNCSKNKELSYFLAQAKAFGYFNYHGYKIPYANTVKIAVNDKSFDFEQFKDQNTICYENVTINQAPENCKILNEHIFDSLLCRKIIKDGFYQESDGLIKLAAKSDDKILKLFISSNLSKSQYYCLLNQAKLNGVKLELYFSPAVNLPRLVKESVAIQELSDAEKAASFNNIKAKIIVTNNVKDCSASFADALIIDIEDHNYQDLVLEIKYKTRDNQFTEFEKKTSDLIKNLKSGQKIILRGKFDHDLLKILQPLLKRDFAENLTLIIDKEDKPDLAWLGKDNYKEIILPKLEKPEAAIIAENFVDNFGDEKNAINFLEQRKEKFETLLSKNSIITLCGRSGSGKTSLLQSYKCDEKNFAISNYPNSFTAWAEDKSNKTKILFIDDASGHHFTTFNPLLKPFQKGEKRKIFYQGKFYTLDKNHKVVFSKEHDKELDKQKLFSENAIAQLNLQDLPQSYIYHLLKTEIFDKVDPNFKLSEENFHKKCDEILAQYQQSKDCNPNLASIRGVQEDALRYLSDEIDKITKTSVKEDIADEYFISTSATKTIEDVLNHCLAIKEKQRKGFLPSGGRNGFLLRGASGLGKSSLIKAHLEARNIDYIKIESNMPLAIQENLITEAAREGKVIWIDEIDTCINKGIAKTLNRALDGLDPVSGEPLKTKGFLALLTANGIAQEGRDIIKLKTEDRLNIPRVSDSTEYKINDIKKIIRTWRNPESNGIEEDIEPAQIEEVAEEFCEIQKNSRVNIRELKAYCEEVELVAKKVSKEGVRDGAIPSGKSIHSTTQDALSLQGRGEFVAVK